LYPEQQRKPVRLVGDCASAVENDADLIRLNDKALTWVDIYDCESDNDIIEKLDALKNNTLVHEVNLIQTETLQLKQEALDKLSEVMECNKPVEMLRSPERRSERGLPRERLFATYDFKAICQLLSKFPSLKRVTTQYGGDLREEEGRFTAVLEMLRISKTIEQAPSFRSCNDVQRAAIKYHCHNNMMHNQIELVHQKGLLAANVPNSAWPLILTEFSGMPDVLYYLLQQNNGAMIGPTCHGCKRKQDFD